MLSLTDAAEMLGVSKATLTNWKKSQLLIPIESAGVLRYKKSDVRKLKARIMAGDIPKLITRANKRAKSQSRQHIELATSSIIKQCIHIAQSLIEQGYSQQQILSLAGLACFKEHQSKIKTHLTQELSLDIQDVEVFTPLAEQLDGYALLTILHQQLTCDGDKARSGAIYTPYALASQQIATHLKFGDRFLDPCCGSGIYLVAAIRALKDKGIRQWWHQVYGIDSDPSAALCARLSCYLEMDDQHYTTTPHVYCRDALHLSTRFKRMIGQFDLIASNPPWGAHFTAKESAKLIRRYPTIVSKESFSYFLCMAIELTTLEGCISFLLPESLCFTLQHKDVRHLLLTHGLCFIEDCGHAFQGLLTQVVRIDLKPENKSERIRVQSNDKKYILKRKDFLADNELRLNYRTRPEQARIIQTIESRSHFTLQGRARWGLGIVTGNNQKFLHSLKDEGIEAIFRGTEVDYYRMTEAGSYLHFDKKAFQQCADESIYRCKAKLIYKFISRKLVFAYDDSGSLTLNSANILIPQDISILYVLAALNSQYANFYFQHRFHSIKVLRSQLEQIPLPLLPPSAVQQIEDHVRCILKGGDRVTYQSQIDQIFNDYFGLEHYPER